MGLPGILRLWSDWPDQAAPASVATALLSDVWASVSRRRILLDLHGIGPSGAARLVVEVGDITRFPTVTASPPGMAPP
jgi:hypothetical protein